MIVETSNRAHGTNPAAAQLPRSPKTKAFEGVVMYYGYRFYDPETGRWPSRDPIAERGGVNLYGMVYNNTYGWIDVIGGWPSPLNPHRPESGLVPGSFVDYQKLSDIESKRKAAQDETEKNKKPCCNEITYDASNQCCINGSIYSSNEKETVTLSFRIASIPFGDVANSLGKRHCSVRASWGESGQGKLGAGVPGQGANGCAATLNTEMVDHKGESEKQGVINVTVTVNKCCFYKKAKIGNYKGVWIPLVNDCNTVIKDAVDSCGGDYDKAFKEYYSQNKEAQQLIENLEWYGKFHGPWGL